MLCLATVLSKPGISVRGRGTMFFPLDREQDIQCLYQNICSSPCPKVITTHTQYNKCVLAQKKKSLWSIYRCFSYRHTYKQIKTLCTLNLLSTVLKKHTHKLRLCILKTQVILQRKRLIGKWKKELVLCLKFWKRGLISHIHIHKQLSITHRVSLHQEKPLSLSDVIV